MGTALNLHRARVQILPVAQLVEDGQLKYVDCWFQACYSEVHLSRCAQ